MSVAHGMTICTVYICFITLERYVQKFYPVTLLYYRESSSPSHLEWVVAFNPSWLLVLAGVYMWVLGDDIPVVHAWKQDHCSWTCWSVQTYTHVTLWPTVCSALPWWHNPKFYCQCKYKSVYRCVGMVGWANMSVKALERERGNVNVHVCMSFPLLAVRGWRWILHWCFSSHVPYCTAATLASYSEGHPPLRAHTHIFQTEWNI